MRIGTGMRMDEPEANDGEEDHGAETLANLEFKGESIWEEAEKV